MNTEFLLGMMKKNNKECTMSLNLMLKNKLASFMFYFTTILKIKNSN